MSIDTLTDMLVLCRNNCNPIAFNFYQYASIDGDAQVLIVFVQEYIDDYVTSKWVSKVTIDHHVPYRTYDRLLLWPPPFQYLSIYPESNPVWFAINRYRYPSSPAWCWSDSLLRPRRELFVVLGGFMSRFANPWMEPFAMDGGHNIGQ